MRPETSIALENPSPQSSIALSMRGGGFVLDAQGYQQFVPVEKPVTSQTSESKPNWFGSRIIGMPKTRFFEGLRPITSHGLESRPIKEIFPEPELTAETAEPRPLTGSLRRQHTNLQESGEQLVRRAS